MKCHNCVVLRKAVTRHSLSVKCCNLQVLRIYPISAGGLLLRGPKVYRSTYKINSAVGVNGLLNYSCTKFEFSKGQKGPLEVRGEGQCTLLCFSLVDFPLNYAQDYMPSEEQLYI